MHTHRTIVDGEKKSPTAIALRCPDNRRELRVHATTVVVVVVVIVITYSRIQINRKCCQSCSPDQLTREKIPCPRSRLKIWFRKTGLAVPPRVSLLILYTSAESGAYSSDSSRCPQRCPYIFTTIPHRVSHDLTSIKSLVHTGQYHMLCFKAYRGTMYYCRCLPPSTYAC